MPGHGWLSGALADTALATTAYSAGRVVAGPLLGRRVHYDVAITRALMGASMAGMFAANLSFLSAGIWQAAFAVILAWFAMRAFVVSQNPNGPGTGPGLLDQTGHLLSVAAMLYMLRAMPSAPARAVGSSTNAPLGMTMDMAMPATHGEAHSSALALLLGVLLLGHAFSVANRAHSMEPAEATLRRAARGGSRAGRAVRTGRGTDRLPPLAPRADAMCEAVTCIAMALMLAAIP